MKLQTDSISEISILKHFIIFSIFFSGSLSIPVHLEVTGKPVASWLPMLFGFALTSAAHYYGIWLNYQANQKGDGLSFFPRLFCLSLPVSLKLLLMVLVFALVVAVASVFLKGALHWVPQDVWVYLMSFIGAVYVALFYILMSKYMVIASGNKIYN